MKKWLFWSVMFVLVGWGVALVRSTGDDWPALAIGLGSTIGFWALLAVCLHWREICMAVRARVKGE